MPSGPSSLRNRSPGRPGASWVPDMTPPSLASNRTGRNEEGPGALPAPSQTHRLTSPDVLSHLLPLPRPGHLHPPRGDQHSPQDALLSHSKSPGGGHLQLGPSSLICGDGGLAPSTPPCPASRAFITLNQQRRANLCLHPYSVHSMGAFYSRLFPQFFDRSWAGYVVTVLL